MSRKSFLAETLAEITRLHPEDLGKIILILPSKRAGAFARKALREQGGKTTFLPRICSTEDFIGEIANLEPVSNLQLLFEFYSAYCAVTPENERDSMYEFTSWAGTILQDFNEIDRYLIDPDAIFEHLFRIREIDHWTQEPLTDLQQKYLGFWKDLKRYYHSLTASLSQKGLGYQGMIYREASEQVEYYIQAHQQIPHYFIGFNALNKAEQVILQEILANCPGDIFWDTDQYFLEDTDHDAGLFMRKIRDSWPHVQKHGFKYAADHYTAEKKITITGVPGNVQQAKYLGHLLQKIQPHDNTLENTAVVLAQEALLPAVLNALPESVNPVNITSGFPLQYTPFASFFETLIQNATLTTGDKWYHHHINALLTHPVSQVLLPAKTTEDLRHHMGSNNTIYLETAQITAHSDTDQTSEILKHLFPDAVSRTPENTVGSCLKLIAALRLYYRDQQEQNNVYLQYLYRFYQIFNQLKHLQDTYDPADDLRTLLQLYRELLAVETIDFQGEPLSGLQVMGMLESRNLDFETVILTSVNEGVLPQGKTQGSFIPFDIKRYYELPTYKEKDAIYTYHFYRLLQRAKNIYLVYNTATDILDGGEQSRFIRQVVQDRLPLHRITEVTASPEAKPQEVPLLEISKTPALNKGLQEVATQGFSPSSLTNFIRNPIDFYRQRVLGIKELDEVEETVAANTLGTIVHDSLETLFTPCIGRTLLKEDLANMRKLTNKVVTEHFAACYADPSLVKGQNLISYHVAQRYVEKYLNYEEGRLKNGDRIVILMLETPAKIALEVPDIPYPVYLKGKVDRVEMVNDTCRIVDYKTGGVNKGDLKVVNWEDIIDDYKYSKAFQVLCYALMLKGQLPAAEKLEAGIVSLKNIQNGFMPFATAESSRSTKTDPLITTEVLHTFSTHLNTLLQVICDKHTPFVEKEIETHEY